MKEVLIIWLGDVNQSYERKRKQRYQSAMKEGMAFIFLHFLASEVRKILAT